MIINRHNYEEFFLLYVDNELTSTDRIAVENFVNDNQDLAKEFHALQEAVLLPEMDEFLPKSILYQKSGGINLSNCEEYFLLHVDNELNAAEKEKVEKFVLQHPATQPNFTLLQKTRLEAENVIFEKKELLYKTPSNKIVWMSWSRIAVAALIAGVAMSLYLVAPIDKLPSLQAYLKVKTNQPKTLHKQEIGLAKASVQPVKNATDLPAITASVTAKKTTNLFVNQKNVTKTYPANRNPGARMIRANEPIVTTLRNIDLAIREKNEVGSQQLLAETISPQLIGNEISEIKQTDVPAKDLVKQTVYRELDTDADERENSFLFGSTRINKNKLRGLIKKASSLFDKKADKGEADKTIQIASFEIKGK